MTDPTATLMLAATGIAFVHTLLGPDHYLPFVALSKSRGWSLPRTLWITGICGVGHVLSSLLLGGLGILAGATLGALESVESQRGEIAAWALLGIGVVYMLWGLYRGRAHRHAHRAEQATTFWALFIVFVLGPCEPLIPLFMVPASNHQWDAALAAGIVFAAVTIGTMLIITAMLVLGLNRLRLAALHRWTHALAGAVIAASASAMLWLGA